MTLYSKSIGRVQTSVPGLTLDFPRAPFLE